MPSKLLTSKIAVASLVTGLVLIIFGIYQIVSANTPQEEEIKITHTVVSPTPIIAASLGLPESTQSAKLIAVDLEGAVSNPGVYSLSPNSRISDALQAADGLEKTADLEWVAKNINLATIVNDGDKIYIPVKGDSIITKEKTVHSINLSPSNKANTQEIAGVTTQVLGYQAAATASPDSNDKTSSSSPDPNAKISINHASLKELDVLPGVGPVTAQKIIDNRPYVTLEDLKEKKAVGKSVYEKIKDRITL